MRKHITTKNAIILILVLLCIFLVLLIRQLLTHYLSDNDNPIIWFALAIGLAIFFLGQIRKYLASRKRKASIISRGIPELNRLISVMDDNLFYILVEIDTLSLPVDLANEIKVTCKGFQKVLFNQKDKINTLENELYGHPNYRSAGTPAEGRGLAATIDSIDNAIVDQLHLMHNLVMKLQKLKDNDEINAIASVLLNESGANIWYVYAKIKDEFKLISGNIKEVKDNNKSKERIKKKFRKTTKRVIKVSDKEYQLPCSVCGKIAVVFKFGIFEFYSEPKIRGILVYTGITHESRVLGRDATEKIFDWLEEDKISEVHSFVQDYATMEDGIDAYCPDCDKIYCRSHYDPREEYDEGWWYDCTYGTCPEGHTREIDD